MKLISIFRAFIISHLLFLHASLMAAPLEYEIKAAFIYNFTKFVEWVDRSGLDGLNTLPLCVLGEDPFGEAIDKLEGKAVQDLSIRVQRIKVYDESAICQILFVSKSESGRVPEILASLENRKGVLTISDIKGFADGGGVIELVLNNNKVSFIINIEAAKRADLYLSSKILRLANVIGGDWGN